MSTKPNYSDRNLLELKPVLVEHHQALEFCSRIREGLKKEVELTRIRAYTNWFQTNYLESHFEIEEKFIFRY